VQRRALWLVTTVLMTAGVLVPGASPSWASHVCCVVAITPESDTNILGQQHALTATLRPGGTDPNGTSTATCSSHGDVDIDFEVEGAESNATYSPGSIDAGDSGSNDLGCVITSSESSCSVSYTRSSPAGQDSIVGEIEDESTVADTVTKTWNAAGPPALLNVTPETETNNVQTQQTLTATVRDSGGRVVSGARVDFELMSGPNDDLDNIASDADLTCTSGSAGTCTVNYTDASNNPAAPNNVDRLCGWLDTDNDNVFNQDGSVDDGGDCNSESAGESEDSSVSGTDTFGTDATDIVTKTWSVATAGPPALLNVTPDTESVAIQTKQDLTVTVRDAAGKVVSGARVDFELMSGPNDDLNNDDDVVDLTCTTGSAGTCTVEYTDASNNPGAPGNVDTLCAWLDPDNDSVFNAGTGNEDGGACNEEAVNATENSAVSGEDSFGNNATDLVTKTWIVPSNPTFLNVTPEASTRQKGTEHELTVVVRDQAGKVKSAIEVDFEIVDGPNEDLDDGDPDLHCETGSNGVCDVDYQDTAASADDASDLICAWIDTDQDDEYADDGAANDGGGCAAEGVTESDDSSLSGTDTFGNDATDKVDMNWAIQTIPQVCVDTPGAIIGTSGSDQIEGTDGDDVICTLGGADTVFAGDGNDIVLGGRGGDTLRAGNDADRVVGGKGNDVLFGDDGRDVILGKGGGDSLSGGHDSDHLGGGKGNDLLDGGPSADSCRGGAGRDRKRRC